jgi:hypothetical protein
MRLLAQRGVTQKRPPAFPAPAPQARNLCSPSTQTIQSFRPGAASAERKSPELAEWGHEYNAAMRGTDNISKLDDFTDPPPVLHILKKPLSFI